MSCASCFNFQNLYIYLNNLHLRPHCLIVCLNVYHFQSVFHFVLHTYTQTDSLSFALYYTHTRRQTLSLSFALYYTHTRRQTLSFALYYTHTRRQTLSLSLLTKAILTNQIKMDTRY